MIEIVTLNTIVTDVLLTIRGAQISQSEPISKRQLEAWVHEYRARLLKQDLDKGKMPNPDYIQTIQALELEEVGEAEGSTILSDIRTFRTKLQIPKTIDLNFKSGFMYIGTINGKEIQFVPEGRARWQKWNKYTGNDTVAYLKGGHLYVENDKALKWLTVRGVFEIPPEVSHLNNPNETIEQVTENSPYPIPINLIPTLKEMILKGELNIISRAYSDNKTDANDAVSPNNTQ
jgi:hypothetical protein